LILSESPPLIYQRLSGQTVGGVFIGSEEAAFVVKNIISNMKKHLIEWTEVGFTTCFQLFTFDSLVV